MTLKPAPNELQIIRIYDAPVDLVWSAWTDPEQTAQWWGPRGFTLTTHHKDLRVGGTWNYTMHGPDGTDYPNITTYHEVEEHRKLVYDHGASENTPPLFRVTVTFSPQEEKTRMEMIMALPSKEAADQTRLFIKQAGGNATWDRLAEYLERETSGTEQFVINRTFKAPPEVVFEMWTNPEHIAHWLAPAGMEMQYIRADIKPGGESFFAMSGNGMKFFGKAHYLVIDPPQRLVYTQQFCDQNENISRHPMAPLWPETMLTKVEFAPEGEGETRVTVYWTAYGEVAAEELATFVHARGGMTMGWTGSFDKLDAALLTLR